MSRILKALGLSIAVVGLAALVYTRGRIDERNGGAGGFMLASASADQTEDVL